ncbi:hypothetical protein [Modestobacter sp. VKM Ac-2985]|uniref:hypothetical protein n=1 Tax=Modestobacter sp. VKM Ac-2985 TaxID=3004139 RepID=UPI0022AB983D|nr:hypothetical protein [Modestobacter sp. VKM Ac-2985]MCZ2838048.1 hypothetical protein [Modestobacter sp. VKM Ac-2985]
MTEPAGSDPATEPTSTDAAAQGPEPTGGPVDPAVATSSPDPGQTGRDRRED